MVSLMACLKRALKVVGVFFFALLFYGSLFNFESGSNFLVSASIV